MDKCKGHMTQPNFTRTRQFTTHRHTIPTTTYQSGRPGSRTRLCSYMHAACKKCGFQKKKKKNSAHTVLQSPMRIHVHWDYAFRKTGWRCTNGRVLPRMGVIAGVIATRKRREFTTLWWPKRKERTLMEVGWEKRTHGEMRSASCVLGGNHGG